MRHRIGNINTGLGNPSSCRLPNTWSENERFNNIVKLMLEDALELTPIKEHGGLDYEVELYNNIDFKINFGYEPAYQYDELLIYHIESNKSNCGIQEGKAQGYYGSNIKIVRNTAYDKCENEFKEFIDKWHSKLLEVWLSEYEKRDNFKILCLDLAKERKDCLKA